MIFSISECKYKGKCKCKGKCLVKGFLCPKCGIYILNAAFKRDFLYFRRQVQGKMQIQRQMHLKMVYELNATFISWMPLRSVICQFQKANTKAKCKCKGKCKGKCIGKCFWCPKCGIYLLNAALKRIFSISECKYKGKYKGKGKCIGKCCYALNAVFISWMLLRGVITRFQKASARQMERQTKAKTNANTKANAYENGFYALNAAFISWMPLWSVICRFQNANTKAKCKCKGKCIRK